MPINQILASSSLSSITVTECTHFIIQLLSESLEPSILIIGGPGITVEIDETKMGKRKYHRGHHVEGVWAVCGVERTAEKKYFAVEVKDRTASTLKEIIHKHVHPGLIILTDMCKAYKSACINLGFNHQTVNHSVNFKDPETGVLTNTIEGHNNGLKTLIRPRNRTKKGFRYYYMYYIWRKTNKKNIQEGFLNSLREIILFKKI